MPYPLPYLLRRILLPSVLWIATDVTLAAPSAQAPAPVTSESLIRDGDAADKNVRRQTVFEDIARRIRSSELSQATIDRMVDHGLELQAKSPTDWCRIIEEARANGKVSNEKWRKYINQCLICELKLRPAIESGDPLPIDLGPAHISRFSTLIPQHEVTLTIDDQPASITPLLPQRPKMVTWSQSHFAGFIDATDPALSKLPAGKHEVALTVKVTLAQAGVPRKMARPNAEHVYNFHSSFVVQPSDRPTVRLEKAPDLLPLIQSSLHVAKVDYQPDNQMLLVMVQPDLNAKIPVNLSFRATVRANGKQWVLPEPVTVFKSSFFHQYSAVKAEGFDAKEIDVLLEPDVTPALKTTDVTTIWDGKLEFLHCPLSEPPPENRPKQ